ncbi:hypothetical protein [Longimicrobium sp.]|uniref:hypothetical protein n=1 Tax=Longimicrobium sp. TaxID=2029185 RepID=UPI002C99075E|nr:hypothetical protein [Longimicrobium sp.]HSU15090.1 hypothetical protein [Longimicrobium sp.]
MRKKLSLNVDELAVSSFETGEGEAAGRGTVHGEAAACTCNASCVCPSAIYWCAEIAYTVYSCDYTKNASCITTPT